MEIILGLLLIGVLIYLAIWFAIGAVGFVVTLAGIVITSVLWISKKAHKIWKWAEAKDLEYQNRSK